MCERARARVCVLPFALALIGRIYTSFYVVPKRTIAYEDP